MNNCILIFSLVSLNYLHVEGSPMPLADEGSATNNQQKKIAEILNGIQVVANEPLRSGLVKEFEAFKDRIVKMSSSAKNISKIVQLQCLESLSKHVELFVEDAVMRHNFCGGQCTAIVVKDFDFQLNRVSDSLKPCITGKKAKAEKDTAKSKNNKPREKPENAALTAKKVMEIFKTIEINATEPLKGRLVNELQSMELKVLNTVIDIEKFSKIKNCFDDLDESVQKHASNAEKQYCKGICINTVTSDFKREIGDYANSLSPCLQKGLN